MELDPHTLHVILQRIRQQMRCPQCGEKVPVEVAAVRLTGDDFLLMQLKCEVCEAFIVLHASLKGLQEQVSEEQAAGMNISSCLCGKELDVDGMRAELHRAEGSFTKLFESMKKTEAKKGKKGM